jgi:DNA adenine methylase
VSEGSGRTPLTYYGGKQRLAAQIVALMPPHHVYLEPFAGGAAVLFAKPRAARETLNDIDRQVMPFWRALRDRPDELIAAIAATPSSRAEWNLCREQPDAADDVEAARRFLVWIDQSFSREGTGWSPPSILFDRRGRWQAGVWANLPDKLARAAHRLAGVALEHGDALELIARYDQPDTVIYCDPPYAGRSRLEPGKGYRHDQAEHLWPQLVDVLSRVEHAAVILSGYPCHAAEDLGWARLDLAHKRSVTTRSGSTLADAPETVWINPAVEASPRSLFS